MHGGGTDDAEYAENCVVSTDGRPAADCHERDEEGPPQGQGTVGAPPRDHYTTDSPHDSRSVREGRQRGSGGAGSGARQKQEEDAIVDCDEKMSEVDDIVQTQTKRNSVQEWTKQRRTFLEEKHRLSLLTVNRKPNVPQVEVREEVPVGILQLSEMGIAASTITAESSQDGLQRTNGVDLFSRSWEESHMLRLAVPKGKTESSSKIILKAMGLWKQTFRIGRTLETEERQVGRGVRTERGDVITRSGSAEDEVWRELRYEGE
jgi:hypothetical protein